MRSPVFLVLSLTLGPLFLSACGHKDQVAPAVPPSAPGQDKEIKKDDPSFDPDKGLFLPETTKQSMGLTTGPVERKTFQSEQRIKFQVFREADEQPLPGMKYRSGYAYASTVLTEPKLDLKLGARGQVVEKSGDQVELFQINVLPNLSGTELLVEIADPHHEFLLTGFCTVAWKSSAVSVAAAVPDSALLRTTEGIFVYLQNEDHYLRTKVKTGASGEGFTEITDGVAAGDSIVTSPVQTLWLSELKLKTGGGEP